ncbi:MAG: nitroreductase family protein [Clostridia bacterium]|nr:nitroreductase family protein [Clostridia bacterium]
MLKELVEKSRSYRSFKPNTNIEESVLLELVDIARKCPAAMNTQPLKYRLVTGGSERDELFAITRWAGKLGIKLPPEGHEPSAYIVICHDKNVAAERPIFLYDIGIVTQTIMLAAAERGLGGCIIGSATEEAMSRVLGLSENIVPKLILALGVPDEKVVLTDAKDGDTSYFRDGEGTHYSPKRQLSDIIIK